MWYTLYSYAELNGLSVHLISGSLGLINSRSVFIYLPHSIRVE